MTAPRARKQHRPSSPPDLLPSRRGGHPSPSTASAAGRRVSRACAARARALAPALLALLGALALPAPAAAQTDAPTDFRAAAGDAQVTLAWKARALDSGVTRHEFRYKTDGDYPEDWTPIPNSAPDEANEDSFTVTMLTNGVAHTFELRAVNAAGEAGEAGEAGPVTPTLPLPAVTIAADHESFTAVLDQVTFTLTRTEDPAAALDVSVALTQDKNLIGSEHLAQTVTFRADEATATLNIPAFFFAGNTVTGETALTATVEDGTGYVPGSQNTASTRIRVADPAVTASFEQDAYTFDEAAGDATLAVILRTATGVPIPHADIYLFLNTATITDGASPDDFEFSAGDIEFVPSDFTADGANFTARKEVTLAIVEDELDEPDEALTVILEPLASTQSVVALREPDGTACPTDTRCDATVTINDNDDPPTLSVADASAAEARGVVTFEVTLSPASGKRVTVDFAASTESGDTATSPADFTAKSGTLTFNPGVVIVSFEIQTVNDSIFAADETFTATLSNATNAAISDATAKGTIINDDAAPTFEMPADALVSNLGRSAADVGLLDDEFSQRFTTGSNEDGYTLAGVDIVSATTSEFALKLCGTTNSGAPASPCTELIPGNFEVEPVSFTAPADTRLVKETTYTVTGAILARDYSVTLEDGQDAAAGWSIENALDEGSDGSSWSPQEDGYALLIAIRGYEGYEGTAPLTGPALSIVGDAEGNEGEEMTFTVTLSEATEAEVTAMWTASQEEYFDVHDWAVPADLAATTGPVFIAAGETTGTFKVRTADDSTDEHDEKFTVTLSGVSANAHLASDLTARGTIIDDDEPPMLSVADASNSEERGRVEFTVTLSPASGKIVNVDIAASAESGDTATSADDFEATSRSLSFAPGQLSRSFPVPIITDTIDEPDETFTVTLSNATNATISDATAKGTITHDQVLSVGDAEGNEGDEMTFTVTLSKEAVGEVEATWTASIESDDTAVLEDLGSTTTGPVSIAIGETMGTFKVPTAEDENDEDDETFTVTLSSPSNATLAADPTAKGTITDAEVPVVTIAADNPSIIESQAAPFTLSRTGSTAATLTVTVAVTQDKDRDLLPDGAEAERTVTFAVDSATTALTVALENDDLAELPGDLTVEVQAGMGYTVGDPASATVRVGDVDIGRPQPANLMAEAGSGVGEVVLSWEAYAPHLVFARHQYRYKTDGDYPTEWTDIPSSGLNSGPADGSNLTGYTVTGLVGGQVHTFQVRTHTSSSSASDSSNEATATPRSAVVSFGAESYSVDEGGTVEVTVQLDAAPGREVVVPVSAAGAGGATPPGETGADWSGVPESVTFGATDTEQTFTLAATDDADVDAGESVSLSFGTLPDWAMAGTPSEATVTIVDNDAADAVNCTLDTGDLWCGVVTVGTSSDGVGFVAAETETDTDVGALTDNNGDQTITIGSDSYTISALLVRNSPVGALSIDLDESFPTDDVATLEFYIGTSTKTFKVSEAIPYAIGEGYYWADSGLTWTDGGPDVTLRLRRAALPVVTIAADRNSYAEVQGNAGFTLSRTGSTAATLTVTVEVTQQVDRDLLPDGAAAVRTVTFAVGGATAALTVALENDDLAELPGNLTVRVQAGMGYTVGAPGSATVSVADFDTGRPQPANLTASAGAGVGEVALSWDAHAPQLKFSRHQYRYKTDGNYAAWTDIPNSGQNDSLGGDGSNLTGYTVTGLVGGQLHTFQVRTYSSSSSVSDPSDEATVTPRSAAVSFGAESYSVDEGGTVEVTVQLDAAPGREVVVPVSAAGAGGATPPGETGADWSGVPESVTFGATDTEQTFTLAATDDTDADPGESVALTFGTLPAGVTAGTPSEATVTIVDAGVPVVTIAADKTLVWDFEGTAGFTLSRTGPTAATLTVTVEVTQEVDRDLLPDGAEAERTVMFAVNSAMAALSVALENDDLSELAGDLTVEVQAGMDYTVGDPASATVEVRDGDEGNPQPANLMAEAGVGEVALSWDAHAPHLTFYRHQYRYKTDGNYAAWTDIPNSGQHTGGDGSNLTGYTVTGLVGGQSHTFQVRTHHLKPDGITSVVSDTSNEATATPRSAAVSFGAGSYSVDEGGTVEVTVQLDAAPGREVTVPVSAAGAGGATPPGETGADWSGVPESVTFGATDTAITFALTATDDTDVDPDESVALSFGTLPDWAMAGTPSEATVTIVDDDLPVVTIAADTGTVIEFEGAVGFTLSRTGPTAATLTVTVEVTQQVDRDLLPDGAEAVRTVTFAVGSATTALRVTLDDDDLDDVNGTLTVEVQAGSGYTVGDPGSATVSVIDLDTGLPQPANLMAEAGSGVGEVALSWDAHAPGLVFARHQYRHKTDGDYPAAWTDIPDSGQHDTAAGDGSNLTGYTVTGLVGGQVHTFQVRTYTRPSSVSDPSDEATATPPRSVKVSFGAGSYSVDEGGTVEVTVRLDAAPGREVTVPVSAAGAGGATPPGETGADWSGVPENVTFGATDTAQTFTLAATDDTDADPGESVSLTFGTLPAGVTEETPTDATVTIVDDDAAPIDVPLGADTLVSTAKQDASTTADGGSVSEWRIVAQEFRTGSNADGYTLTGVDIVSASTTSFRAKVCETNAGGLPTSTCTALTPPDSFAVGVMSFTAPADPTATLTKEKTYAVVVEARDLFVTGRNVHGWGVTDSTGEDPESAAEWTVTDGYRWSTNPNPTPNWSGTISDQTLRMVIRGAAVAASTDATLSDLVVNDGTSDLTLTPDFVPDKYEYAASVVTTVDEVTVTATATANDSGASIEYLDEDDMTLADADTSVDGHQVAVAGGDTVIKMKVTAQDTTVTQTYTVTVNRAAPTCTLETGDIWCGVVTVATIHDVLDGTEDGHGFEDSGTVKGDLSDKEFPGESDNYTIDAAYVETGTDAGRLNFSLTNALAAADRAKLVLRVDGSSAEFAFADAPDTTVSQTYQWPNSGLDWSSEPFVTLRLIEVLPELSVGDAEGNEGVEMTFTVTLSKAAGAAVTATWTASIETGDTAVAADLGSTTTGTLTIASGVTATFAVPTADDSTDEENETFTVTLSGVSASAQLASDPTATGMIIDNDGPPAIVVTPSADALVSNVGQDQSTTLDGGSVAHERQVAQAFTTGTNEDGYTFAGVDIVSASSTGFTAQLCGTDASGLPTSSCTDLTPPDNFDVGAMSFTPPADGTRPLTKDTTYAVVLTTPQHGDYRSQGWSATDATGEDMGSQPGWSIADGHLLRISQSETANWSSTRGVQPLRIAIRGAAVDTSMDATLKALVVNDGNTDLTLTPTFAPGATTYTAMVANDVDEVTVTATKNRTGASIEYLDASDMMLDDADTSVDGHQVPVAVGDTVIQVKVTAEDGDTTQTYAVTVKRAAVAPTINDVTVTSTPKLTSSGGGSTPDTYGAGETIEVTVTFDEPVTATAGTDFVLSVGGDKRAPLLRGSGTATLVFGYTVQAADTDDDGIWIANQDRTLVGDRNANPQTGTIASVATDEAANLTHAPLGVRSGHKVDGSRSIVGMAVTSTPLLTSDTYGADETIRFTVTFNAAVDVTGDPVFTFSLGNSGAAREVDAAYESGSGTAALVFGYTVVSTDVDGNGIFLMGGGNLGSRDSPLELDSDDSIVFTGTSTDVPLAWPTGSGTQSGHKVDGSRSASTPDAPTDFVAGVGDMQVTLAWVAPGMDSGVTRHEFQYKTDGDYLDVWTAIANSAPGEANENAFTVTGLTNEVPHTFELRAVNSLGEGAAAEALPVTPTPGICDRTQEVHEAIVGALSEVDDCAAVTVADLAGLGSLEMSGGSIASLKSGDFAGLTGLTFLTLGRNSLITLPEDVFSGLTALRTLDLGFNDLSSLDAGVFSDLEALVILELSENELSLLPETVFSGLTELRTLNLEANILSSLDAGLFSNLTALVNLNLANNKLASLPDELFLDLTSLGTLSLGGNTTNPMQLTVTVEKVETDQVRARVLAGAPFAVDIPVTVVDGTLAGGATTLSVALGSLYSEAVDVTRTAGTTAAVTVDVDLSTQPTLPGDHSGYEFAKATTDLPATILPAASSVPTLSVADAEGNEGDGVTFTVTLSPAATAEVTATLTASIETGDTATEGTDFTAASGTLTFMPSETMTTFTVQTTADTVDEENETFTVTLSGVSANAQLATDPTATGTIVDDDAAPIVVTPSAGALVSNVGQDQSTTLPGGSVAHERQVAQVFMTGSNPSGYTFAGADIVSASSTGFTAQLCATDGSGHPTSSCRSLNPGSFTIGTVSFTPPANDTLTKGTTYAVVLTTPEHDTPGHGTYYSQGWSATDSTGEDTVSAAGWSIADGHLLRPSRGALSGLWGTRAGGVPLRIAIRGTAVAGTPSTPTLSLRPDRLGDEDKGVNFQARLTDADGEEVEADVDVTATWTASIESGDTAVAADLGTTTGTLTIKGGTAATSTIFKVTIEDDALDEDDETFTVTLSGVSASAHLAADPTAKGTIVDNDDPPTVSVGDATATEGDPAEFTVTLSAVSGRAVMVDWATSVETGDTATSDTDFTAASGTLTIPAGNETGTVMVVTVEDTTVEDDETFTVTLSNAINATLATDQTATGTITGDDVPEVTITADSGTVVEESGAAGFTLSRTGSTAAELTVTVAVTQQVDRDFLPDGAEAKRTVTFAVDSATTALSVELENDDLDEAGGDLTVEVQAGSGYTVGDPGSATVNVIDTDTGRPQPANLTASAGAGVGEVVLSWDAHAPELVFDRHQYQYKTDGGYAAWTDIPNSGQHIDDAGDGSNLTGYTVTGLVGGQLHTFQVRTYNSSSSASDSSNEATATPRSAVVSFGAESYSVDEGGTVEVTVQLDAAPGREVVVPVSAAGAGGATGADWSGVPESVTFGATDTEQTFTLTATDDTDADAGESVALSFGTLPAGVTAGTPSEATVTIVDNDVLPTLSVADAEAAEGSPVTFTVTLSAAATGNVTVNWTASIESGDTAVAADLGSTTTGTATVTASETTAEIMVSTTPDTTDEDNETFTVTLSSPSSNAQLAAASTATGTITDDDDPPTVSVADAAATEGSAVTFTVTLSPASGREATVNWATSAETGDTATSGTDFTAANDTLTFMPGDTTAAFTVATAGDSTDEEDETFTVTLSSPSNATLATDPTATGTITDDDDPPTLSVADASATEGSAVTFTATLSPASGRTVTVNWATSAETGDTATSGTDFTAANDTLTFMPGDTTATFTVATAEDTLDEPDETFTMTLSSPSNATLATDPTAAGTIEDNDAANNAPSFTSSTTFNPAENQTAVGTVAASDSDAGDNITGYEITGGTDQSFFSIGSDSGVLTFNDAPNFEAPSDADSNGGYVVEVQATSGTADRELTRTQTITVTVMNADEQPDKPAKPTLSAVSGSTTRLVASWTEPGLNGGPEITSYSVEYREGTTGTWIFGSLTAVVTLTITGLTEDTEHQVRVQALNGETPSAWSDASDAVRTNSAANAPVFSETDLMREVPENSAAGTNVGDRVTADAADPGDTLTYTLEGTDASLFDIVSTSGQIQTKSGVTYDYEATINSYSVTVTASTVTASDATASATVNVTINVTDADEQPDKPAKPTLSAVPGSHTSLVASWTEPGRNGGPDITGYRVEYREGTSGWVNVTHNGAGVTRTITGLTAGTEYQVRVRALNGETPSAWSDPSDAVSTNAATDAPTVASVAVKSAPQSGDTYGWGETIVFTLTFSEKVRVTGQPQPTLAFDLGRSTREARYAGMTDTDVDSDPRPRPRPEGVKVHFAYTVQPGDRDTDGIEVGELASAIDLGGARIQNAADLVDADGHKVDGADANLAHAALGRLPDHKVDGGTAQPPAGSGITIIDTHGDPLANNRLTLREGTRGRYGLKLNTRPTHTVRVVMIASDGDPDLQVLPTANADKAITPDEWETPFYLELRAAIDDDEENGERVFLNHSSSRDPAYHDLVLPHVVVVEDDRADDAGALSVADAEATEGVDDTLDFVVKLDRRPSLGLGWEVTVDYRTQDGTATAGSDYTSTSGTLTFAPGEDKKTVSVPIMDDAVEDNGATFTLVLSNAFNAGFARNGTQAVGTIWNTEPLTATFPESVYASAQHKGPSDRPQVVVAFSAPVEAFEADTPSVSATGASVDSVQRLDKEGLENAYVFFLTPEGHKAIVFGLHANRACTDGGICAADRRRLSNSPSATVPGPSDDAPAPNTAATGTPTIGGTPQVGEELTASTSGISDADGLDNADFAHQWIRASADIDGATGSTYTPVAADEGERLKVRVGFTDDAGHEERLVSAATDAVAAAPPTNTAAAGAPTIGGTPRVGEELTASTSGISDADGLDNASFAHQWMRNDADIGEATGSSYTPVEADEGERLKVRVGFTDDAGHAERLVSAATAAVAAAPEPLTAAFEGMPAEHDGESAFRFRVAFSDAIKISYKTLRDASFAVTGGEVTRASRVDGRRDLWKITVEPDSHEAVRIHLPETTGCGAAGAICADDGRPLSHALSAAVAGPAGLSVADAEADEAPGATMRFAVTLDRAAVAAAKVDWATADGTARAGDDYAAAAGTLKFAPGERSKTVAVTLLDDSVDDAGETFRLLLSNASGARLADAEGIGTIRNADPLPRAWLARFGRTAADHAVAAIAERFDGPGGGDSHATFAGRRLWNGGGRGGADDDPFAPGGLGGSPRLDPGSGVGGSGRSFGTGAGEKAGMTGGHGGTGAGAMRGPPAGGGSRPTLRDLLTGSSSRLSVGDDGTEAGGYRPTLRDLLIRSSFRLSDDNGGGSRRLTGWGGASTARFNGVSDGVSVDGEVATFLVGADAAWNRWLAGISVAHSLGAGAFRGGSSGTAGELDSTLTAVHPYLRYQATDRLSAWGVLGYGAGDLTLATDGSTWDADTFMRMAAGGARGVFLRGGGGLELAAKMDARLTRIASAAAAGEAGLLGATAGDTSRLRLLLEGSRTFAFGAGRMLTPTLELGVRRDGGDAETGAGVDLGGSLRYADAALGLTVDAGGRYLAAHEDDAYREWGASASIRLDPGTPGRGLTLSVMPSWGAAATGGAERLWSAHDARGLAGRGFDAAMRLRADIGYGLPAFGRRGAAMPFAGMSTMGRGGRDWRAGARWTRGAALRMSLEATRRETAAAPPSHGIEFRITWRPGSRDPARGAAGAAEAGDGPQLGARCPGDGTRRGDAGDEAAIVAGVGEPPPDALACSRAPGPRRETPPDRR